jgi:hypothetical protein
MLDLFNDQITAPTRTPKSAINATHGFTEFWQAYPKSTRKVAKQQALDKWCKLECSQQATHITQHVNWMCKQEDWLKQNGAFICAPLVYLNQQRWVDWEPEVELPKRPTALQAIEKSRALAKPMPEHIRDKIKQIKESK